VGRRIPASQKRRLQTVLRDMRHEAGLTQADVARVLGRPQSFVSKYETGERRLDVLEMREVCSALGSSFPSFARRLERHLR
jgi:transcriptional regulator with XRE-family HTH domain